MAEVPPVLPVRLPARAPVPAWLGGEPVTLPEQMPSGLPEQAARQLAAVLADQQSKRSGGAGRSSRSGTEGPVVVALEQEVVLDQAECDRLVAFLDAVPDRRKRRGRRYRLSYLLAVAVVAMMAADLSVASIAEWAATAPAGLLIALGAQVNHQGQPQRPDATTIGRALTAAGQELDRALCAWVGALRRAWHHTRDGDRLRYRSLHVDGKAVAHARRQGQRAPMLLCARADDGTVAAQLPISAKTNEIPMFARCWTASRT